MGGRKNKPYNLLEIAEACRTLRDHENWGWEAMSSFFKKSIYMLRQIDRINDLNPKVKKLVNQGDLRIEQAYQLSRLNGNRQDEAALKAVDLSAHETRKFVDLLLKSKASIKESKKIFEKQHLKQYSIVLLKMNDDMYTALQKSAKQTNVTIHDYALQILQDFLDNKM